MADTCATGDGGSGGGGGAGEFMLFGVRVVVDSMRKSVSLNNLSQYVQPPQHQEAGNNNNKESNGVGNHNNGEDMVASGYASADDAVHHCSGGRRERKRGVPWTEAEHKQFLLGLQKVGKGDWKGISRNFVKTRTPTQVASHAQKYFLRRSNLNRRRRRSSLFDITTDTVTATTPKEEYKGHEKHNICSNSAFQAQCSLPLASESNSNFHVRSTNKAVAFPATESLSLGRGHAGSELLLGAEQYHLCITG